MKLGLTGSQDGTTPPQHSYLASLVRHPLVTEVHHGDCVGFDEEMHEVALAAGKLIYVHPPTNPKKRAYCTGPPEQVIILPPKPYLSRNHDIVDATEALLAGSKTTYEVVRSGTWATVRYGKRRAERERYPVVVVGPDGVQVRELARSSS